MPCGVGGVPTGAGLVDGGGWLGGERLGTHRSWGQGGGARARGGVQGGFGSRQVGGRGKGFRDGANFATCVVFLLKDALWGGGGTHRSWPGGRGGRPRALVAGEGWGA